RLRQLARGCHSRTLVPDSAEKRYVAELNFEHGIDSLEPLAFVLSRLLHEICGQLQADSLATNEIRLQLTLEGREIFERVLRLPFASCDPATFLRLLQHNLATHSPDAEIYGVNLTATPVHPRLVQQGLFLPAAPQPEKLELTLARVTAIVGQGNVGSPEILDTHRPGAFRMEPFNVNSASKPGRYEKPDNNKQIVLAIRLFRPPLPAEVTLARGRPIRIRSRVAAGVVTAYAGPWRISGDWWTPATWARDEWDVQIDSGALFRIYNEGLKGWYVEGSYD
ncbi:MAG TPA: hypothetical protein VEQ63_00790, partial [Bryobacteraceae bacterium]|nr:hypothetical protein [Bryobacteraceae bacterium]